MTARGAGLLVRALVIPWSGRGRVEAPGGEFLGIGMKPFGLWSYFGVAIDQYMKKVTITTK